MSGAGRWRWGRADTKPFLHKQGFCKRLINLFFKITSQGSEQRGQVIAQRQQELRIWLHLTKGKMSQMLPSLLTFHWLLRCSCLAAKDLWRLMKWKICLNWSKSTQVLKKLVLEKLFKLYLFCFQRSMWKLCASESEEKVPSRLYLCKFEQIWRRSVDIISSSLVLCCWWNAGKEQIRLHECKGGCTNLHWFRKECSQWTVLPWRTCANMENHWLHVCFLKSDVWR